MEFKKSNALIDHMKHTQSIKTNTIFVNDFEDEDYSMFQYYINRFIDIDKKLGYKREINIDISSYGGNLNNCLGMINIVNSLQKQGYKFIGRVDSKAMSAGFFLLIACDKRVATPHAELMLHDARNFQYGVSTHVDKKRDYENSIVVTNRLADIVAKYTNVPREKFMEYIDRREDWYIFADKSVEENLGFIDELL